MPTPITPWEMTIDHFLLIVSAITPVGISDTRTVSSIAVPRKTSWNAERSATTTRYRLVTSQYPRKQTDRPNAHRRNTTSGRVIDRPDRI